MKHLPAAAGHLFEGIGPINVHTVAFFNQIGILHHGRQRVRKRNHTLCPVRILGKAHALQILAVIGVIVDDGEGAFFFKTLNQQTFAVHIGKAQRTFHLLRTARFSPFNHLVYQCFGHIEIFYEVYPAKAHHFLSPLLIGIAVDDGSHAAHHFIVPESQVQFPVTKSQGRILVTQRLVFVVLQCGHPFVAVFIEIQRELDKPPQHAFPLNGDNGKVLHQVRF